MQNIKSSTTIYSKREVLYLANLSRWETSLVTKTKKDTTYHKCWLPLSKELAFKMGREGLGKLIFAITSISHIAKTPNFEDTSFVR